MAKSSIHVTVITPERQVVDEMTDSVVIPAHDGELGVLPGRAALMCELGIGQLRYNKAGQPQRVLIDGGFAQVNQNEVVVLTQAALPRDEITPEVIAAADRAATTGDAKVAARAKRRASVMRSITSVR
jgi:F-type H+-transporting ATPase subunit epsilon